MDRNDPNTAKEPSSDRREDAGRSGAITERTEIPQLTFTRYIAAVVIVFFHFGSNIYPFSSGLLHEITRKGNLLVSYFYFLSGFVMTIAYGMRPLRRTSDMIRFWNARFARIYPMHLLAIIATILMIMLIWKEPADLVDTLIQITCLNAWIPGRVLHLNYPSWAISVEVFFYLLFPFIIVLIDRYGTKRSYAAIIVFWIVSMVIHISLYSSFYQGFPSKSHDLIFYNPLLHLNTFTFGILGGLVYTRIKDKPVHYIPLLGIILALLVYYLLVFRITLPAYISCTLHNGLLSPLFFIFTLSLSLDGTIVSKTLSSRFLQKMGHMSYAVFILQVPVYLLTTYVVMMYFPHLDRTSTFYIYLLNLNIISLLCLALIENPLRNKLRKNLDLWFVEDTIDQKIMRGKRMKERSLTAAPLPKKRKKM